MTGASQISEIDRRALDLEYKIRKQIMVRDRIIERMQWLETKVEYRNRRIRELSAQRTDVLNFKLPI